MKRISIQSGCAVVAMMVCAGVAKGQAPIITTTTLPNGEVGAMYIQAINSTGNATTCCTWNPTGPLGNGLSLIANGTSATIRGTPTTTTPVSFMVTATDSTFGPGPAVSLTITIIAGPGITPASLPAGEQGAPYAPTLAGSGGSGGPYQLSETGALPSGVQFNNGVFGGTPGPGTAGSYPITVAVTDSAGGTGSAGYTIVIAPPPSVSTTSLPQGEATTVYNSPNGVTLSATGGAPPYTWAVSSGALPTGLAVSPAGVISGTLAASAVTATFAVQATDSLLVTSLPQSLTLTVVAAPTITTASPLPQGEVGAAYSQPLAASGGSGSGYTFSLASGALPAGLSINGSTITGTPTTAVTSASFSIKVTDSAGGTNSQPFTLTVIAGPTITTSATLPSGEINAPYPSGTNLAATGGSGTGFTWSVVGGALPQGMSLSSGGAVTGTPTASGPFSFTAKVTDSLGGSDTQLFSLTITAGPTITNGSPLPSGTVGVVYTTVMLAATGGTQPYTWSIAQGALPTPLTLDGTTGNIAGTPTASGTSTFTVQVSDAKGVTGTKQFSITIAAGLTIVTAPSLPNGTIGQAYTLTLAAAGGTSPYSWQVTTGALPGGLTLASSGTITGTPTSNGTFTFSVAVTDSNSVTVTKQFSLTVASGLNITNAPTLPSGVVGGSYSQTLNATGGTSPYTWTITAGSLPGGLTFSSIGAITGTPSAGGTFGFTVTVTDSNNVSASKSFSLSIAALLAISTQPALPSGGVGTPYTQALTAVGGTAPYTWSVSAGSLPAGLTLSPSSGTISGTPTSVGNFSFTVQLTDNNSVTTTKVFTLAIVSALTITTQPTLPGGAVGVAFSQSIVVVGGNAPYTWSIASGSLPAGLNLAPASGAISGTPTSVGNFTFTVQVVDSASVSVNKAFSIAVVAGLTITTAPVLPSDSVGVSYTVTLAAAGGRSPYTWAVSAGGLPGGLTLDAKSGSIFGTPTASGSFVFTVKVTDNASNTASKQFSIGVAAGLIITTAPVLPNGAIGAMYAQPLGAAGGAAPYSWSITQGALPGGLTLDPATGAIAGTPRASGPFSFTVKVTDSASATATKQFSLAISASLSITTPPGLPNASLGVPYSLTFAVAGGSGPYQWSTTTGTLPGGLTLDPASGNLTGTPTGAGAFSFTVTVTDSAAHQASQSFTLTIVSGLAITTASQLPTGFVASPYSQTLVAAGGVPQFRWTVTAGTLPAGLTLSPAGVISGTPTASGLFKFTVQVTDNTGATASLQFSLTIGAGLTITSPSTLPSGTPGQAYAAIQLAAAGGSQCCTWVIVSGQIAPGLALSTAGIIGGTPTTAGAFTFTVQATDSTGTKASQAFTISILPPALPQVDISGVPETSTSAQQIDFSVALASGYALDINGTVTLTFAPDAVAPADDPAIQLSTGGRTAKFKIPANTKHAVFTVPQIALQTGTVSGTITLSFTLEAGGTELPSSGLTQTITIARAAPTISAVKIVTSSNSFQVQVTGFAPPRELTEADLTFTPASGSTLQTTSAIIDLTAVGKQWFQSSASAQFGSQFILVMPFTATQGSVSAVASVSVVLKDSTGASQSASATF